MFNVFLNGTVLAAVLMLSSCVSVSVANRALSNDANATFLSSELPSCETLPVMSKSITTSQPFSVPASDKALDPDNIAFLNWNIYKGNGDNWQKDLSKFAKSHHLMTIQEAKISDEFTALLEAHDFNWIMNTAFYLNGSAAGVMNVASFEAVHSCGFKVNEPLIRVPKSTLISYYSIAGLDTKLLVANIHGINFTLGVSDYRQQMEKLYEVVKQHDGPMIVAGDFNSWSSSRMEVVQHLVQRLDLAELDHPVNHKTHIFGNAIDHVFYRQLEIVSNKVWQVSSSDHNPISVKFRYREQGSID